METQGQGLTDKIDIHNVFKAPHGGGMGDGGNTWAAILPALMGERNVSRHGDYGYGWGGGAGALGGLATGFFGGLVGNALFRGGLGGFDERGGGRHGGDSCASDIERAMIVQDIGELKRDVATSANETQAVVNAVGANAVQTTLQQTIALQQALSGLAASTQAGFCATERQIANSTNALSVEILNNRAMAAELACSIKGVVHEEGERTRALIQSIDKQNDSRRIEEQNARIVALEAEHRRAADHAETRLQISNTNTAVAAQAQGQQQQQQQFQAQQIGQLVAILPAILGELQVARATNNSVNVGNSGPIGSSQTANPTNVRA